MKRVFAATELMIRQHQTAKSEEKRWRKYHNNVPYAVHPARVTRKVQLYLEEWSSSEPYRPFTEEMLIVSLLHDVPEDTDYSFDNIEREFGKSVRDGVWWLTNPSKQYPHLRRKERKEMDREHLAKAPNHIKIIKAFDRIDNLYDMIGAPSDFVLNVYVPESRALQPILRAADDHVGDQLIAACDWVEAIAKGRHPVQEPNYELSH